MLKVVLDEKEGWRITDWILTGGLQEIDRERCWIRIPQGGAAEY
jgi:hypothetical protein